MVHVEFSAFEAMQVQTALAERAARLIGERPTHPFEADVIRTGREATNAAMAKVTDALYGNEPEPEFPPNMTFADLEGWTESELREAFGS